MGCTARLHMRAVQTLKGWTSVQTTGSAGIGSRCSFVTPAVGVRGHAHTFRGGGWHPSLRRGSRHRVKHNSSQRPGGDDDATPSAVGFKLTMATFGVLFLVALYGQLPRQAVFGWFAHRANAFTVVWPQHWSFFTNTADSNMFSAYRRGQGNTLSIAVASQMSARNAWGLGSTSAAQFDELDAVASEIPTSKWVSCNDVEARSCLAAAKTIDLINPFRPAMLCGALVIVRFPPLTSGQETVPDKPRAGSVVSAQVSCTP